MARGVYLLPDVGDAADDARGRLVVDDADRFDCLAAIIGELCVDDGGVDAVTPVAGHEIDLQAHPRRDVSPQRRKVARLEHQDLVAGGERVDERGFPCARTRARVDDDGRRRLEDLLEPAQHLFREHGELGPTMIDRGPRKRAQHTVRDVGRTRDLKKMSSAFGHSINPIADTSLCGSSSFYFVALVPPGRYVLLKLLRVFSTVNVPSCCAVTLM